MFIKNVSKKGKRDHFFKNGSLWNYRKKKNGKLRDSTKRSRYWITIFKTNVYSFLLQFGSYKIYKTLLNSKLLMVYYYYVYITYTQTLVTYT